MDPKVQAIFRAGNEGVHGSQSEKRKRKERGKRFVWDDEDRYRLGKLANEVSNKEALKSAKKINPNANESTIRSFKKAYIIAIKANPALSSVQRAALKKKKRGKPLKFGKHDAEIVQYLRAIRKAGGKVNRTIVQGAALGILRRRAPHMLYQRNVVSRGWCNSIRRRLKFVKRKGTKAAKKVPVDAPEQIHRYLNRIHYTMKKYNIPPSMFVTFDESSSSLVPASDGLWKSKGLHRFRLWGWMTKEMLHSGCASLEAKSCYPLK